MDAVEAWNGIKGSRMVIYHLEDAVISYDPASLHFALSEQKAFGMANADLTIPGAVDSIRLGLDGEAGQGNHHNLPLERFPEFPLILRKCRQMVGLTPDLPRTIAPPTGGPSFGGRWGVEKKGNAGHKEARNAALAYDDMLGLGGASTAVRRVSLGGAARGERVRYPLGVRKGIIDKYKLQV